jgi:hypothetical protein
MATRMNKTAKLAFYTARKRSGDTKRLAEATGYTTRFVNYVLSGERNVNDELANEMYKISYRRVKNSEYANA